MKPMIIDISKITSFNTTLFHSMVDYKDNILLIGRNEKVENAMRILGLDKIIKHETDPERVKVILTEV